MTVFEQIMDSVDIQDAFQFYGIPVVRNKALCPFHPDKNPSVGFKHNRYRCWACGESGSVVDFVSKHYGISIGEAVKKINADFGLGLNTGKPDKAKVKKRERQKNLVEAFEAWESRAYTIYADELRHLEWVRNNITPLWFKHQHLMDYYSRCMNNIDRIEHIVNTLIYGEFNEKLEIYLACRKEVERLGYEHESSSLR